ncbi:MAG: response regulator [Nitrosotalea sp.]
MDEERYLRILVAEDNRELTDAYKMALEERGHAVTITRDGIECMQTYKEFEKRENAEKKSGTSYFDAVILDHFMPGMDGIDTAIEIQRINPKQRIIFITGGGKQVLRKLREVEENVEFMTKPLTLQALIRQIESWPVHLWRQRVKEGFKEWDGYVGTSVPVGPSRA